MNDESKNWIVFLLFAAIVLLGWQLIAARFFPAANPPVTRIEAGRTRVVPSPSAPTPQTLHARSVILAASPRIRIVTSAIDGSINLKGGRIDDLVLNEYKQTVARNAAPIRLFSPSGATDAYFAGFGWSGNGVDVPGPDTLFAADAAVLTPGHPVTLSWTNPARQRFLLRIAVDDRFMFTVEQGVANGGAAPVAVRDYALIARAGKGADVDTWTNHVGPIGVFGNGANYDITYANLEGKEPSFFGKIFGNSGRPGDNYEDVTGGWLGFGDKYWLAALIPDQSAAVHAGFKAAIDGRYQADISRAARVIAPGSTVSDTLHVFAGAKEVDTLDRYEGKLHIRLFGKAIDWGWFEIVEKPIFQYLHWLFRMVGNFGLAIILLTLTIRGLMFPIAQRQFASMANMRAVQPKMKALQERYKDDKVRQQQEVMALYKAEGVNPLAGCLPTFLQIPVFYALYKVLLLTIEMRHQPFVGWIRDLSAPDPLSPINLFGVLPFTPPHVIAIGVVPIVLGVSMFFQFKLNPAPMDDAQKQVFAFMPWVLMFVMAPFAVGLQIYWITSNCLTIAQQRLLYARHPGMRQKAGG